MARPIVALVLAAGGAAGQTREAYDGALILGSHYVANRFTDRYLVYGSLGDHRRGLSEKASPPVYAVPVGRRTRCAASTSATLSSGRSRPATISS